MLNFDATPRVPVEAQASRRQFLQQGLTAAGALAALWAGASPLQASTALKQAKAPKRVVLLHLLGGVSQLETFDPKPEAPPEIRGPAGSIATAIPGVRISDWLPRLATVLDRCTLIRSVHHTGPATHEAGLYALFGGTLPGHDAQNQHRTPEHLGDRLAKILGSDPRAGHVVLSHEIQPLGWEAIPAPQCLAPTWTQIQQALQRVSRDLPRVSSHWLTLAAQFAKTAHHRDTGYAETPLGRRLHRTRSLLEQGVSVVSINHFSTVFDEITWDMHTTGGRLPTQLRDYQQTLCPDLDRNLSHFLFDLEQRGLLDETLVAVLTEMGRTPQFNLYGGRDHQTTAWSVLLAGCGVPRGLVWGSTDSTGTEVAEMPLDATELHRRLLNLTAGKGFTA